MRRRTITSLAVGGTTVAGLLAATAFYAPSAFAATTVTVASDGTGTYTTVQAAINAVPSGNSSTYTINIKAGTYRETISIPATKPYISLVGTGSTSSAVVLVQNHASGQTSSSGSTYGTAGSASVTIAASNTKVTNLTMSNDFDESAYSLSAEQAVAVNTYGDRVIFNNVRILGNQDTLLVNTPSTSVVRRLYVKNSYIEGDVDFIFGAGTAVFQSGTIHSLNRGSSSNNGYVTAAATNTNNKFGFLFWGAHFTSDAADKTVYLGRPWHPSGDVNAIAQVLVRSCTLDAHIKDAPWTDMSGFSWEDARFFEYGNSGDGATVNSSRPQMTAATAASYVPTAYLAGSDSWNPIS